MSNTHCINKKIENALSDKNITNIMHKASKSFSGQLDEDDIYTCQINALWKCFLNFKPEKNVKFTTYLFNGVRIECIKQLKFNQKLSSRTRNLIYNNVPDSDDSILKIDLLDEAENDEELQLMKDKISNMTIQEMSDKRVYSRETVRKRLKKISKKLHPKFM
jgi:DNA-directed RNA polymerase specialized sigma subunit|tara:strand:- start:791 stop:1276 length:486 start_codon:yes stop_codon:yes gene_type:complete